MVTLAATGKVVKGGPVQITASTLGNGADHPAPAAVSEWEKGRAAYFTAMYDEGTAFEPAIEDGDWWKRPSIEDDYGDIRRGN